MKNLKFKLTPVFMLAVLSIAAFVPFHFGLSAEAFGMSAAIVAVSAMLIEPSSFAGVHANFQRGEIGDLSKVEKEYKDVKASLEKVSDDLKSYAEKSQKEIKNHATMSEETKASVDKLLIAQGELQARLQAAEQMVVKMESGGGSRHAQKTAGEQFIESDGFEAFAAFGNDRS